jgi:hypothetical protein
LSHRNSQLAPRLRRPRAFGLRFAPDAVAPFARLVRRRLRSLPFETQIIERYRESSVEEALVEMYLAGVSVRRVEDITEALWGTRTSREHRQRAEPEDLSADRHLAESAH